MRIKAYSVLLMLVIFTSCSRKDKKQPKHIKGEYITRSRDHIRLQKTPFKLAPPPSYPWVQHKSANSQVFAFITKEYFRCKGNVLNPPKVISQGDKEVNRFNDCGGQNKHSLPLNDGKEFIFPVLIDILNFIQISTQKQVIITSGHRCPIHNTYINPSPKNSASKHQIGAEVNFYVDGLKNPQEVIKLVMDFYQKDPQFKANKSFLDFKRSEKPTDVQIKPWFNKEVFVKCYLPSEGRNHDNSHPHMYFSIQVRYDRDKKEIIQYTHEKAQQFLRK